MTTNNPKKDLNTNIKGFLSEYLGIEPDDISDEDSLVVDLHMKPTDLTDFVEKLDTEGMNTASLDLTEIETVADLVEKMGDNEYIE